MDTPEEIKVSIKDLTATNTQSRKVLLNKVTLDILKNEITAIIGPSASGKTTLLKCINRMSDLERHLDVRGEVFSEGKNIISKEVSVYEMRRKYAMIFSLPVPFPSSIYQNVALGASLGGIKNRQDIAIKVEQSLKDAALWEEVKDRLNDIAFVLSGGQQQRLCIARSLALNPEVLMFDEATSGLDPISTAKIEETVMGLKAKTTIIWVTNHVKQAARISKKTGFLLMGDLIEYGDTGTLFMAPKNIKTDDYISGKFG